MPKVVEIDFEKLRSRLRGESAGVAQMLGITPESLSRKLRGHHKLTLDELNRIVLHLREDVDTFFIFAQRSSDNAEGNAMQEERARILRGVAAKEISVTDAEQMLEGLRAEAEPIAPLPPTDPVQPILSSGIAPPCLPNMPTPTKLSIDDMIRLREHDVEPSWVKALYEAGITDLSVNDIVELAEHDVEIDWLHELRALGIRDLGVRDIVELSEHGVEVSWLKELREAGLTHLSTREIVQLAEHEVDVQWIKEMRELGLFESPSE